LKTYRKILKECVKKLNTQQEPASSPRPTDGAALKPFLEHLKQMLGRIYQWEW
jgi:hypothetical protein